MTFTYIFTAASLMAQQTRSSLSPARNSGCLSLVATVSTSWGMAIESPLTVDTIWDKKKLCLKQIIFFFFSFLKANFQMIRYCLWEEHFQKFLSPPTKSFISILLTLSLSILGKSIIKSKNFFMWLISSFRTSEWCFMLMWLHMCMEEMGHWNF